MMGRSAGGGGMAGAGAYMMQIEVQLKDGSWAAFDTALPEAPQALPLRVALSLAVLLAQARDDVDMLPALQQQLAPRAPLFAPEAESATLHHLVALRLVDKVEGIVEPAVFGFGRS